MNLRKQLDNMAEWYERKDVVVKAARKAQLEWFRVSSWHDIGDVPKHLWDGLKDAMGELHRAIEDEV